MGSAAWRPMAPGKSSLSHRSFGVRFKLSRAPDCLPLLVEEEFVGSSGGELTVLSPMCSLFRETQHGLPLQSLTVEMGLRVP